VREEELRFIVIREAGGVGVAPVIEKSGGVGLADERPDAPAETGPEGRSGRGTELPRGARAELGLRQLVREQSRAEGLRAIDERPELLQISTRQRQRRRGDDLLALREEVVESGEERTLLLRRARRGDERAEPIPRIALAAERVGQGSVRAPATFVPEREEPTAQRRKAVEALARRAAVRSLSRATSPPRRG
jgi:hypothetical protein